MADRPERPSDGEIALAEAREDPLGALLAVADELEKSRAPKFARIVREIRRAIEVKLSENSNLRRSVESQAFVLSEREARIRSLESELNARTGPAQDLPFRIDFSNAPKGMYMVTVGDQAKFSTCVAGRTAETEEQAAELDQNLRAELWRSINDYTVACHGRPDKHVASVVRQKAVTEIESIVRAALAKARGGEG